MWGTTDSTRIAYLDTQDAARMTLAAIRRDATIGKTLVLSGPKAYSTAEVIALCEKLGKQTAKVTRVPTAVLKATRALTMFFQWTRDAADRLAFAEVLSGEETFAAPMGDTYALLGLAESDTTTLEAYLGDFYSRILAKLKEVGGQSRQRDFYLVRIHHPHPPPPSHLFPTAVWAQEPFATHRHRKRRTRAPSPSGVRASEARRCRLLCPDSDVAAAVLAHHGITLAAALR